MKGFFKGSLVTETTPGHNGTWVSCGDALQDGGLVDIDSEVLRTGQDDWLPVDPGSCNWTHRDQKTSSATQREKDQVLQVKPCSLWGSWALSLVLPVTDSWASWLYRVLAMLEATQRNKPLSVRRTLVICSTPLGSRVYLHDTNMFKIHKKEIHVKYMLYIHNMYIYTRFIYKHTWGPQCSVAVGLSAR